MEQPETPPHPQEPSVVDPEEPEEELGVGEGWIDARTVRRLFAHIPAPADQGRQGAPPAYGGKTCCGRQAPSRGKGADRQLGALHFLGLCRFVVQFAGAPLGLLVSPLTMWN